MPKCENCYHKNLCKYSGNVTVCENFKDKFLIAELPCKVGDILFVVDYEPGEECIDKVKCNSIEFDNCGMSIYVETIEGSYDTYIPDDFGESIFLTRTEAEKALEERKNE